MQLLLGSGKTAVLVERIINKILNDKIDIDKLLVVTFTNAAASEMRERILNAIYKIIDESEDEEEIQKLQRQIVLINKASICTIDSFCLDVIRNNFYELNISPNFRIADTSEIELLKQEVLEELFEEKYEEQNIDFQKLIKTYTSYRDDTPLKDIVLKIYSYISSSPYPKDWLTNAVEKFNIDSDTDFGKTEWGKLLIQEFREELIDDIALLENESNKLSLEKELLVYERIIENDVNELKTLLANLDNWNKAYSIAHNIEFIRWSGPKVDSNEKEIAKEIRNKVKEKLNKKMEKIFVSNSEEAIEDIKEMYKTLTKLKDLIFEFEDKFNLKKRERNILDFSDVEHYALKVLIKEEDGKYKRTEIAKRYMHKFEEIAIDEYQDSNLVQEYILTSVSRGNNIFMVGDVKQSIYRFRQARPELFLEKYKTYRLNMANENGLKIQLFKNFRSRENILKFTNIIFENLMSEELGEINYTEEEFLNLGAIWDENEIKNEIDIIDEKNINDTTNENLIKINSEEDEEDEEEKKEEIENIEDIEIEAKFVANKIEELINSNFQVYDLKLKQKRNIVYKDIVILMRSTKGKAPIFEKALMEKNIPVYSDISSEYIESMEIQTILSVLKIIDNPIQDIPLVTVMRSSIGKFTDNELVEIRLVDQHVNFYTALLKAKLSVSSELCSKINTFLNQLEIWRKEQEFLSLDELIWKIYEDTGFLNYMGILPNGAFRQANLKMLFERAKQYEAASFKGLFNFIKFIEKLHSSSGDLSTAKMIGENEDVVRIMSIHKSKGLEFPVVFIVSSSSQFNLTDLNKDILLDQDLGLGVKYIDYDKQIKYDTLTKRALRNKTMIASLSEEMRILYVALTRAKEKIYIIGKSNDYQKQKEQIESLLKIYNTKDKINSILIKKYKSYLDWILLVYYNNLDKIKENTTLNIYQKHELIKKLKPEERQEIDLLKILEENSKEVSDNEILDLEAKLKFKYKYEASTKIPSKTSITIIANKDLKKNNSYVINEDEYKKTIENYDEIDTNISEDKIEFPAPKFLNGEDEEKISASKKGTIMHLCLKNLEFEKDYELTDVKKMIQELQEKAIITEKEANSINLYHILNFTKSKIWQELKTAREYHKEEPFYIKVSAKEIGEIDSDEEILAQGIIDLYYITKDNRLILLDYKTDYVQETDEEVLKERHKRQLMLYKDALEKGLNRKVNKVYIYSTVLGRTVEIDNS